MDHTIPTEVIVGGIARNYHKLFDKLVPVWDKADGSYVTGADMLLNELIVDNILEIDPTAIIVSEESANNLQLTDLAGKEVYVVDPLDGTENFVSGLAEWGISISHYSAGVHSDSLIYCPELQRAIRTGDPKVLRSTRPSRIAGLSSSLSMEMLLALPASYEYRITGCCVYNMLCVIRGSFASFSNPRGANSWDILAGLNLALEHGLKVTVNDNDYTGQYLHSDQKYRFSVSR